MRVVVLAAGEGTRLRPLTLDRPKCLVDLAGKPLLEHQLDALRASGLDDITLVVGYRGADLESYGCEMRVNERYAQTNMVETLMCAQDLLDGGDDVLVCYSDIVYTPDLITKAAAAVANPGLSTVVDLEWRRLWELRMEDPLHDAESLVLDPDGTIVELGRQASDVGDIEGQYIGVTVVPAELAPRVVSTHQALDADGPYDGKNRDNMYMTSFLQHLRDEVVALHAVTVDAGWLEVDSVADLETYEGALTASGAVHGWTPLATP